MIEIILLKYRCLLFTLKVLLLWKDIHTKKNRPKDIKSFGLFLNCKFFKHQRMLKEFCGI